MFGKEFDAPNGRISLRWDENHMRVYENGQLLDTISNSQDFSDIRLQLSNGSELKINFTFGRFYYTLNLSVDGVLLPGSTLHFLSIVKITRFYMAIAGIIYLISSFAMIAINGPFERIADWLVLLTGIVGGSLILIADRFSRIPRLKTFLIYYSIIIIYSLVLLTDFEQTLPLGLYSFFNILILSLSIKSIIQMEKEIVGNSG